MGKAVSGFLGEHARLEASIRSVLCRVTYHVLVLPDGSWLHVVIPDITRAHWHSQVACEWFCFPHPVADRRLTRHSCVSVGAFMHGADPCKRRRQGVTMMWFFSIAAIAWSIGPPLFAYMKWAGTLASIWASVPPAWHTGSVSSKLRKQ